MATRAVNVRSRGEANKQIECVADNLRIYATAGERCSADIFSPLHDICYCVY